jgi:hypothetical protein
MLIISGSLSAAMMGHGPYTAVALFLYQDSWYDVLTDIVHLQIVISDFVATTGQIIYISQKWSL